MNKEPLFTNKEPLITNKEPLIMNSAWFTLQNGESGKF